MKRWSRATAAACGWALIASIISIAQDAPRLTFEVASIKPNATSDNRVGIGLQPGGRFTATGVTLKLLLRQAYRVQDFQIIGGPAWTNSDRYDVQAKAPEGPITPNQIAPMIQSLLEDRFKLKIHRETRELPVFELTVAKEGKLQQSKDSEGKPLTALPVPGPGPRGGPAGAPPPPPRPGEPLPRGTIRLGRGEFAASAIPISQLATLLSQQLGRTVIDKTGITGLYDIQLQFTPEVGQGGGPFGPPPAGLDAPPPADSSGPSIFTAVQEQLGLKLNSTRGPVEVIVIDSVDKPSEN